MLRFLLQKLIFTLASLYVLATATFVLMKLIPGNPFLSEKTPKAIQERIMAHYGLDRPIWEQYLTYMGKLFSGDLGISMKYQYRSVATMINESFYLSAQLGIVSIIASVMFGVGMGVLAALYHRKLLDNLTMVLAVLGVSIPSFVLAPLLQYYFSAELRWFPVTGLKSPLHYVLPTIALSALSVAFIARLTRSTMVEVLNSDYIRTARSKGLSSFVVTTRHALRNALLPVVTYIGPLTANVITGSIVIEQVFGIAGIGEHFVTSINNRDYTLIMGLTIFYGIILMVCRFLTDIAYVLVDPRIKLSGGKGG
ncbi:ABC transporter permease [Paenibacillus sp.]|uniref:ABC transporter permease n=1 Tax=Paenibacillus sp. TaxID=58172 RepID=UPI002D4B6119|nr:ABC transporter permease [Paenibacillus sp.]HZG55904.1 ABC transporter permease [Paenibacillus sp.]